jgi:hypothetical protein
MSVVDCSVAHPAMTKLIVKLENVRVLQLICIDLRATVKKLGERPFINFAGFQAPAAQSLRDKLL